MSNRPLKNKKKVSVEEEALDHEVEYRPPGRTTRDLIIQIGVVFLIGSFFLAPMLVFVLSPAPQRSTQQEQQQQVDQNEEQIKFYSAELAKKPNDPTVLANLGYYNTQKAAQMPPTPENENLRKTLLKESEQNLRKALEKDPKYGFAQAELAKNLLVQENFTEAESFINKALEGAEENLSSSDAQVAAEAKGRKAEMLSMSSLLAFQQGDVPTAITKINEVIVLTPGNPTLYQQRASYHMKNNDKEAAKKDFATMVDIGQKTGDQRAVLIGQMMLEEIDKPAVVPTPGATPAANPVPVTTVTPGAVGTPVTVTLPTPTAPATP